MVKGIEHTAIASPDPERLAKWYVDHLQFQINYKSSNSRTHFVKAADGSMIEIIEAKGAVAGASGVKDAGIRHMAITVTDFEGEGRRLRGKGLAFLTEPETVNGNSTGFFRGFGGNNLHSPPPG